jgi:hypothetical protein
VARPKNKSETKSFTVSVPIRLYDYLTHLARHSVLGASESDVATYLITQQVMEMLKTGFHDLKFPGSTSPTVD